MRSSGCWVTQRPLTRLYEDMTASAPPSLTAISNGTRYNSRIVRRSTSELIVNRSNSASLHTKCFTVANTPSDWTPRT